MSCIFTPPPDFSDGPLFPRPAFVVQLYTGTHVSVRTVVKVPSNFGSCTEKGSRERNEILKKLIERNFQNPRQFLEINYRPTICGDFSAQIGLHEGWSRRSYGSWVHRTPVLTDNGDRLLNLVQQTRWRCGGRLFCNKNTHKWTWRTESQVRLCGARREDIISGTERNGGTHCDWPVDGIGHQW